jgi:serine/threonine-protein kinase
MGNIYRARHNMMLEEYALKTLRSENLTDVSWKRFQKEAQAIGRMNHPNIVAIYNFGLHEGKVPYYVMAQLQGKTLHDLVLEHGPMPWAEALPIFVEVCNGMGYAHKKAVIHRDIKPPNIVCSKIRRPEAG